MLTLMQGIVVGPSSLIVISVNEKDKSYTIPIPQLSKWRQERASYMLWVTN